MQGRELEIVPRLDKLVCLAYEADADDTSMLDAPVRHAASAHAWAVW